MDSFAEGAENTSRCKSTWNHFFRKKPAKDIFDIGKKYQNLYPFYALTHQL
jgi:hypothetical protein